MILRDRAFKTESESDKEMPPLEGASDDEGIEYLTEGEVLVMRRVLNLQAKSDEDE